MNTPKKPTRGLGRGLSALMSDVTTEEAKQNPVESTSEKQIAIEKIYPNPESLKKV